MTKFTVQIVATLYISIGYCRLCVNIHSLSVSNELTLKSKAKVRLEILLTPE